MFRKILHELEHHAPFTAFGAVTGILMVMVSPKFPGELAYNIFYVLHPLHVFLGAFVTTSMYRLHKAAKSNIFLIFFVGYVGSIGIATLSDSLIPYFSETLLNLPHRHVHIGFVEEWWLVNAVAITALIIAYLKPTTKSFHAGHVLVSTWASLFHIVMALGENIAWYVYLTIFLFLFLAVWVPCCFSDIVFPLLFTGKVKGGLKHV